MAMTDYGKLPEIYLFGGGLPSGGAPGLELLGGKAAKLARMSEAGLPIPPGFVLPTTMCRQYFDAGGRLPTGFTELVAHNIRQLEKAAGLTFGGERRPLLVSVRSGAAVSMPGMMDTILNIGLSDRTLSAMICLTGDPRHAWDSYRRLVQGYGEVVHLLPSAPFEQLLAERLEREDAPTAHELDVTSLKQLTGDYLRYFETQTGKPFPQDPMVQLTKAAEAVFRSWESPRAIEFRRLRSLEGMIGTAVTVESMVFGNLGGASGAGVAFTRDPTTGDDRLYVDFLWNAQGEDVVSGRRRVQALNGLQRSLPEVDRELRHVAEQLESLFLDVQDFEFTVQEGRLFLLQSRTAKRTDWAALKIACDLVREGLIDRREALARLDGLDLDAIHLDRVAAHDGRPPLCQGIAAGPGVAVGPIALDLQEAHRLAATGRPPILVRNDLSTDDIAGLAVAIGILTARGGRTSHAAVVARQLNKVCVVGCSDLSIAADGRGCRIGGHWFHPGAELSLDGHGGGVYAGKLDVIEERPRECLAEVGSWKSEREAPLASTA
ncbi:MAG TPA: pyruvate, phosphate dikinase [Pirellulales bacterium]|nr:pyruvate, phosphate dikinase [Pirellulales bacterium]